MNRIKTLNEISQVYANNWVWSPIALYLTEDFTYKLHIKPKSAWKSKSGKVEITEDGLIIIRKGYKWDGTSCVPDGQYINEELVPVYSSSDKGVPITWMASLIHDVLYYHLDEEGFPYERKDCDNIFRVLLEEALFSFSNLYWLGVRLFGGIYRILAKIFRKFKKKG